MECTAPATVELLARVAPLPHPVALEVAVRHPDDVARNAALLAEPSVERDELWRELWRARTGAHLGAEASELAGFSAGPSNAAALCDGAGPVVDPVAALRGVVRGRFLEATSPVWDVLSARLVGAPGVAAWWCGELAAARWAPVRVRHRAVLVAAAQQRVGAVLCTHPRGGAPPSAAAAVVWPGGARSVPVDLEGFVAFSALARCEPEVAAAVAARVGNDADLSTLQRVAVWVSLEVWRTAPHLAGGFAAGSAGLAALGPTSGPVGGADPAAQVVAAAAGGVHVPAEARVQLERWLGSHPRRVQLAAGADRYTGLARVLDGAAFAERDAAGRPWPDAGRFSLWWDPDVLASAPLPFAVPPEGFTAAAAQLQGSPDAWRFALEMADGSLSCAELFALTAATVT